MLRRQMTLLLAQLAQLEVGFGYFSGFWIA